MVREEEGRVYVCVVVVFGVFRRILHFFGDLEAAWAYY